MSRIVMSNLSGYAMGSGRDLKEAANAFRTLSTMPALGDEVAWDHLALLLERVFEGTASTAEVSELLSSFYTAGLITMEDVAEAVEVYEQVLVLMEAPPGPKDPAPEEKRANQPSPAEQEQVLNVWNSFKLFDAFSLFRTNAPPAI